MEQAPPTQLLPTAGVLLLLSAWVAKKVRRRLGAVPRLVPSPAVDALLVSAAVLVLFGSMNLAAWMLAGESGEAKDPSLPTTLLATAAVYALTSVAILAFHGARGGTLRGFGLGATSSRLLLTAIPTYLALFPAYLAVGMLETWVRGLLGSTVPEQVAVQALLADPALLGQPLLVGCVVFAIPLFEELMFRGTLLPYLAKLTRRPWLAVLVDALLFAAVHDAGRAPVFVLGVGMAWLYVQTGSLWPSVLVHGIHNGVVLGVLALSPSNGSSP